MTGPARRPVDVLVVSLGQTLGLRVADDQLVESLRAAGLEVELARVAPQPDVRTLMLTDLKQARAAARATKAALTRVEPRQIIYSSTTAALLWPRPGVIRFDALAQATRPGHHGWWQRPLERRRLLAAPFLMPWDAASTGGAPADILARPQVVLPIAIGADDASGVSLAGDGGAAAGGSGSASAADVHALVESATHGLHPVAVTYAADATKKGLDRMLAAWALVRQPGEALLVTGRDALPEGLGPAEGVVCLGRLAPAGFRALVRAVGVLLIAPRREDYGLVQLEALAEGARVVTSAAPGPYAALPLIRELWPEQVVEDGDDAAALGAALRHAVDARPNADDLLRATSAVAPWRADAVRDRVEHELVPALLGG